MDPPENKRPRFNKPEDRKTIALDLKKHIRLERIDPILLSDCVAFSDLVTQDEILEAYRHQALSRKDEEGCLCDRLRRSSFWKFGGAKQSAGSSLSTAKHAGAAFLFYPPIISEKHQWTLQPEGDLSICALYIECIGNDCFSQHVLL